MCTFLYSGANFKLLLNFIANSTHRSTHFFLCFFSFLDQFEQFLENLGPAGLWKGPVWHIFHNQIDFPVCSWFNLKKICDVSEIVIWCFLLREVFYYVIICDFKILVSFDHRDLWHYQAKNIKEVLYYIIICDFKRPVLIDHRDLWQSPE